MRMVERGRLPRRRGMTLLASMREQIRHMIRIVGAAVVRLMARPAIHGCSFILAVDVALSTGGVHVRAR